MRNINTQTLDQIIRDSGVSFKENSISYIFTCPKCSKREKLYLRKRDGRFVCWYCATTAGYQGKPEIALADLTGQRINDIRQKLYGANLDHGGEMHLPAFLDDSRVIAKDVAPVSVAVPADFYPIDHPYAKKGADYLASRGIPVEVAMEYQIRYSVETRRVIFPVIMDGTLIGWQARTTGPDRWVDEETGEERKILKIVTSKGMDRSGSMMFHDRLQGSPHAVLCEGPVDALKCHLFGGAVATMGKSVSEKQVELIAKSGVTKVYLALDPDAASEISRLVSLFAAHDLPTYLVRLPPEYKDLGEMSFEEARAALMAAQPITRHHMIMPTLRRMV